LRWHWSYNLRLAPERTKGALTFGTLVHAALADYYPPGFKRGPLPVDNFIRLYDANGYNFDQWEEDGNKVPARDLGIAMCEGYIEEWGDDAHVEIIAPEMALRVEVYDEDGIYLTTWVGRGDAVYRDHSHSVSRLGMLEHKTAKTIEKELRINSQYGEQGLSYWWGSSYVLRQMGLLAPDTQIDHVLFNWLRKGIPNGKPRNADGYTLNKPSKDALFNKCAELGLDAGKRPTVEALTTVLELAGIDVTQLGEVAKVQPSALFHRQELDFGPAEHAEINKRIRHEAREMSMAREGKLAIYKNPSRDCSGCAFRDPCELHEMGEDYNSILELEFVNWEPYSNYELQEEREQ
jgi:hypothetical protein